MFRLPVYIFVILYMSFLYKKRTIIMFYATISFVYVFICGGHHDSDRIAVLVMVSNAESTVLYLSSCIMYTCLNKDFLPSFPQRFAPGIDADKVHKR